jgi:hypothetical protein
MVATSPSTLSRCAVDPLGPGIRDAKDDRARCWLARSGEDVAEVEIERQHDPLLSQRERENLCVGRGLHAEVGDVGSVVAAGPQPLDGAAGDAHVGEELHFDADWLGRTRSVASQAT